MEDISIKDEVKEIFESFENLSLLFRVKSSKDGEHHIIYFACKNDDLYEVMNFCFLGRRAEIIELCNKISDTIEQYERDDIIVPFLSIFEFSKRFDLAKYDTWLDIFIGNEWDKCYRPKRVYEDNLGEYLKAFDRSFRCVRLINSLKRKEDNEIHISESIEEKREETPIIRITNSEIKQEEIVVDSDEYDPNDDKVINR